MIDPKTPVMASGIKMWEREVERETAAVESAQRRLAFARDYLAQLKRVRADQEPSKAQESK